MTARLTFIAITVFWLTMNGLLWRAEFGARGGDDEVPSALVWRKILTAPDSSSLTIYQNDDRTGYCEFSTGVGQQMATIDADKPPPEGLVKNAGYQIHLAGSMSFGDFTNRVKFDGGVQFVNPRQWRELNFRINTRELAVEIHSVATNQSLHCRISSQGVVLERDLAFTDLKSPAKIISMFSGGFPLPVIMGLDLPELSNATAEVPEWTASRIRYKIGTEAVPVYELQSYVLGHKVRMIVSTVGEILRVELPGEVVARVDQ